MTGPNSTYLPCIVGETAANRVFPRGSTRNVRDIQFRQLHQYTSFVLSVTLLFLLRMRFRV